MYLGHDWYYRKVRREKEEMCEYWRKEREKQQKEWQEIFKSVNNPYSNVFGNVIGTTKCSVCGKYYKSGTFHSCNIL